ncbi:MAG: ABC transporter permease subunit [Ruminococcus sp.]|nr:ABC transporter permease subunit [Ruminococcus sp.]
MSKLLYDNLVRMRRSFMLKIALLFFVAVPAIHIILAKNNPRVTEYGSINIEGLYFIPMVFCVLAGTFLAHDYMQNTIRNKLIVGHTRTNIYISNLLCITAYLFIMVILYEAVAMGVGIPVIGNKGLDADIITKNMLFVIPMLIAISSITVFFGMTLKSNAGTLAIFMFFYLAMAFGIFSIDPEMSYDWIKEVAKWLPSAQLMILNNAQEVEEPVRKIIYAVITTAATTGGGLILFKRADLK